MALVRSTALVLVKQQLPECVEELFSLFFGRQALPSQFRQSVIDSAPRAIADLGNLLGI